MQVEQKKETDFKFLFGSVVEVKTGNGYRFFGPIMGHRVIYHVSNGMEEVEVGENEIVGIAKNVMYDFEGKYANTEKVNAL